VNARVKDVPQFRPLVLWIPLPVGITERIDSLLGPRFLLIAPRPAKRRVETAFSQGIKQGLGLQQATTLLCAEGKRVCTALQRLFVAVHNQFGTNLFCVRVAKLDHLGKFVTRIDMQQRERNLGGEESLL